MIILIISILILIIGLTLLALGYNEAFYNDDPIIYGIFEVITDSSDEFFMIIVVMIIFYTYDKGYAKNLGLCIILSSYLNSVLKQLFEDENLVEGNQILRILLICKLVQTFFILSSQLLLMTDNGKIFGRICLLALASNILLNMLLIPYYHSIGAAVATLISTAILWSLSSISVKMKLGFFSFLYIFIREKDNV